MTWLREVTIHLSRMLDCILRYGWDTWWVKSSEEEEEIELSVNVDTIIVTIREERKARR